MAKKLTANELRMKEFARHYVTGNMQNGSKAASDSGYGKARAASQASRLLKDSRVIKWIDEFQAVAIKPFQIKQDELLEEQRALAFSNIADILDLVTVDGIQKIFVKDLSKLPRSVQVCIESIKVRQERVMYQGGIKLTTQILEVKLRDKQKALDSLCKWAGLYKDAVPDEVVEFFAGLQIIMPGAKQNALPGKSTSPKRKTKKGDIH